MKKSEIPINSVNVNTKPVWKDEIMDEFDQITESSIELHISHFTLYAVLGYILGVTAEKWVHLVAFSNYSSENNSLEPTVYCANHFKKAEVK